MDYLPEDDVDKYAAKRSISIRFSCSDEQTVPDTLSQLKGTTSWMQLKRFQDNFEKGFTTFIEI